MEQSHLHERPIKQTLRAITWGDLTFTGHDIRLGKSKTSKSKFTTTRSNPTEFTVM